MRAVPGAEGHRGWRRFRPTPAVPGCAEASCDPCAPNPSKYDTVNVTHVAFRAPDVDLGLLAANNGTTLGNLLDSVTGFVVIHQNLPPN